VGLRHVLGQLQPLLEFNSTLDTLQLFTLTSRGSFNRALQMMSHVEIVLVVRVQGLTTHHTDKTSGRSLICTVVYAVMLFEVLFELGLVLDVLLAVDTHARAVRGRCCWLVAFVEGLAVAELVLVEQVGRVELAIADVALEVNGRDVNAHVTLQLGPVSERVATVLTRERVIIIIIIIGRDLLSK
jgi:hypothetical protein